jgi:tetratricopeptide (TPR) repeat protein
VSVQDADQLEQIARKALANGEEEAALARLAPVAEKAGDARLWQFTGLLQRSLDQHEEAMRSFATAAQLAPNVASIANGLARTALEAGIDATGLFERAIQLDPSNGAVLLGYVAAKVAAGRGLEAEAQLDLVVGRSPMWIDGHAQLAQLRSILGKRDQLSASLERALATSPHAENLWAALLNLFLSRGDFAALEEGVVRARQAGAPESLISPFEALAAAEQGQSDRADRLFEEMDPELLETIGVWQVRHLLRTGRSSQAVTLIDRELEGERAAQFWPYASIAWRLANDPRHEWLEAGGR